MRVAVVGMGAAGLAVVNALMERVGTVLDVTVFDPDLRSTRRAARGTPYRMDHALPLLNAPARMMSVVSNDPQHFQHWYEKRHGAHAGQDLYVSRPAFGTYLSDVFRDVRRRWSAGPGLLHCVPDEVVRVDADERGTYRVSTANADFHRFDHVVLCVGWGGQGNTSAYPIEDVVERAMGSDRVGVIGTGLTAIDVVRALYLRGFDGRVTMASRRGALPAIRSDHRSIELRECTRPRIRATTPLTLRGLVRLVKCEAESQGVDLDVPIAYMNGKLDQLRYLRSSAHDGWGTLATELCDQVLCDSWAYLSVADRRCMRTTFHPYLQAWCNPMPPATGRIIIDALAGGALTVRDGLAAWGPERLQFANGDEVRVDHIVATARGANDDVANMGSALISHLLDTGTALQDRFGGLQLEQGTWRLLSSSGVIQRIYAVGSLAQGARYYVNALDSIIRSVKDVVELVAA